MKNSVIDRLKSYFDEYFSDATKPTARNLFLIVVSILTLDIFRSVRFAHRHVLSKLSDTSLNAYYYALKTDRLDHESWRNVTLPKALKAVPDQLAAQPLFLSIDDTMVEKEGEKFELCSRLFDHAAHNGSNYLNGHCMVSILLSFPVLADGSIRYLSVPLGYQPQITNVFSKMLEYTFKKSLKDRRQELTFAEKVVWLDSFEDMGNGDYNITFKSAKYNHVRNEINTETMEPLGTRKQWRDGDEEKTHLCIRLAQGQQRYLAVHESNYYGITINCIINYLNECFKRFNEETEEQYHYEVSYEIMPGDDFLTSLKEAKTISALTLTVYKDSLPNEFMLFAGRTSDIADDVEIRIKTPKKGGEISR